ncbi:MAG TPA: LamG-like jellyroll fold domain-containing protein [Bacteroidia bacterium]
MKKIITIASLALMVNAFAQSVPSYIPTNGLVGWYPFTGNANDMSGAGNNGIVVGASLTADRFGNNNAAYYFNGTTNHISIPNNFFDVGWNGFTISCWLNTSNLSNPNNNNTNQCVFNSRPLNGIALDFNWRSNNKYSIWAASNPPSSGWNIFSDAVSTSNVVTNVWDNLIMVKNGTTYYLYINGVLDKTYTNSIAAASYLCKMVIGSTDSTVATETFFGKLDDFGMWNRALTTTEITQVFQSSATSIKNITSSNQIKIYPNPANNEINLTISQFDNLKTSSVEIYNLIGECVHRQVLKSSNSLINVADLSNGVYFVTVTNGEETSTEKIIVNK